MLLFLLFFGCPKKPARQMVVFLRCFQSQRSCCSRVTFSHLTSDAVMLGDPLFLYGFVAIIFHKKSKDNGFFADNELLLFACTTECNSGLEVLGWLSLLKVVRVCGHQWPFGVIKRCQAKSSTMGCYYNYSCKSSHDIDTPGHSYSGWRAGPLISVLCDKLVSNIIEIQFLNT